ncbi:MAG: hypothetical protein ACR2LF_03555 [Jatrophihabitantaceae bacterium]
MKQFSGTEPLVGEIRGLRTFRVDESGLLLPLYSNLAWYDGTNTAACAPPTGEAERRDHPVPSATCECGFYAYGTQQAAAANHSTRFVQAIVSCWGSVVAGTQGVRAEHARIDALWLHPNVPGELRRRVAGKYPSARMYADRGAMVAEYPLSELGCYEPLPPRRRLPRAASIVGGAALLALGALPSSLLHSSSLLWDGWLAVTLAAAALTVWLLAFTRGTGHLAAGLVTAGVLAWVAAPAFGLAGWLLRAPLLRGLLVAGGRYLLSLRPGYFPVVRGARERTFCGVHP